MIVSLKRTLIIGIQTFKQKIDFNTKTTETKKVWINWKTLYFWQKLVEKETNWYQKALKIAYFNDLSQKSWVNSFLRVKGTQH